MEPVELQVGGRAVLLRQARRDDVAAVVQLLADDPLGRSREGGELGPYLTAYDAVAADPAHLLVVAEAAGQVVATLQLSVLPGLSRGGALRAQVEGVRVGAGLRGSGLGRAVMTWAVDEARRRGCALVQLTSDAQREDAHRFYSSLGFVPSHVGFKLAL